MLCLLALLVLCVRSGHAFSWDIVVARANRLEFYNDGALMYTKIVGDVSIDWLTYDPVHNRVLFSDKYKMNDSASSFDIATKQIQSLIKQKPARSISNFAYDPITELLYGTVRKIIYSFLIKPGSSNIVQGDLVINLKKERPRDVAVDSCGGYIYWSTFNDTNIIERVRFDGSEREVIIDRSNMRREGLTIDQQTRKIYWIETDDAYNQYFIESADLNGRNRRTLYSERESDIEPEHLTVSKDFISWGDETMPFFWQIPKNPPCNTNVNPKKISMTPSFRYGSQKWTFGSADIAANYYNIEDNCKALKTTPPNLDDDAINDSLYESLFCLHGTKVSGQSLCKCTQGYTSDRCDISVCQNYCFQGDCSASTEGQPACRCNAGYSGKRCELYACHDYCLNNGVCSLNEESKPICQCTAGYKGERCGVPVVCNKCFQTISMLKDTLNADLTPLTHGKEWESTCGHIEV